MSKRLQNLLAVEGELPENGLGVSEEFLVDDGWKTVKAEPVAAEVHTNGNQGDGPVESPVGIVHARVPGRGDGAAGRPQPEAAPTSLFEWALSAEQERQKELVGAGR